MRHLALAGGMLTIAIFAPRAGAQLIHKLIKVYVRKRRFEKEKFLRDLKHLQSRELIEYRELPSGEIKIVLKTRGQEVLIQKNLDEMKLDTSKRWDGQWRLVMFDVPHYKKNARDALREKLRHLGFYALQKSVFLTPYECEREIDFIGTVFNVRAHILILYARHFEGEEKLRHYFKLS
mgnify:FL=1